MPDEQPRPITAFGDKELADDLAETLGDLAVCERALDLGIETYFNGTESVRYRRDVNLAIINKIRAEQRRRAEEAYEELVRGRGSDAPG